MGTLPLDQDRRLKTADGKTLLVETFTDTGSASDPENGCVWCNLRLYGNKEPTYHLTVCLADWNERWYERWLSAMAALPDYRERFRLSEDPPWAHHSTISTELPEVGFVEIDELLAPAIRHLNELGCRTTHCCQGADSKKGQLAPTANDPTAYILMDTSAAPFPAELIRAWTGARFDVSSHRVYAYAPYGLSGTAAAGFVTSLREWLAGALDETGQRYALKEKRPYSLPAIPALPQPVIESKQATAIKALIRLGSRARFKDFASLKSGTDKWSKVRLPALKEALGERFAEVEASGLDEEHQAKHARWILRGLPPELALRKVKTDMEIAQNAR